MGGAGGLETRSSTSVQGAGPVSKFDLFDRSNVFDFCSMQFVVRCVAVEVIVVVVVLLSLL